MNKLAIVCALGITVLCPAWQNSKESLIKKTYWLIGTWENKNIKGSLYETWMKTGDRQLSARSYFLNGSDTIPFESVTLTEANNRLYYIVTTENQNDRLPVRFASTFISNDRLVFENKAHDFPQVISYRRVSADSLYAEISGRIKGKTRRQSFPMKKILP